MTRTQLQPPSPQGIIDQDIKDTQLHPDLLQPPQIVGYNLIPPPTSQPEALPGF